VCGHQQAPDLALDVVVASLADPAPNEAAAIVEEVRRRPCVVAERAPDGEVVVDGVGSLVGVRYAEAFKSRSPLLVADPEAFAPSRFG
jgi:hypothetical protein